MRLATFCAYRESAFKASRMRKMLADNPQPSCLLTEANGTLTISKEIFLNLLRDTPFVSFGLARAIELLLVSVFEIIDYFDKMNVNVNVCNVRGT